MRRLKLGLRLQIVLAHAILLTYTGIALFPVILIIVNSFKKRIHIFRDPYSLPDSETWTLVGYETVTERGNFDQYFLNSTIVTLGALFLILFAGTMAAFALSEYKFRGNTWLSLYLSIGIMIPIRLGTISLLRLMVDLKLVNTLAGLILVYTASGLPLAIFVLTNFMQQVPRDLKDAARVDGASEYRIYWMVLPLVRPAIGTVAVFNMIPIWNDLWFPLVLAPAESVKTVTLGAQTFLGQFERDWNAILSSLTLSMVPIIILYIIFSRQLIRGLTSGAVKA
jgi:raffinose/stachyose/melibiose transport system permease protein